MTFAPASPPPAHLDEIVESRYLDSHEPLARADRRTDMLRKTLVSACAFTMLVVFASSAYAQVAPDSRTIFQFKESVTVPGVNLKPGGYLFRILDEANNRAVVQVLSADGKQSYATLVAIPVQRPDISTRAEMRFVPSGPADPTPVKSWWVPATMIGWEFVYPREQATRLAKAAGETVLTTAQTQNATLDQLKTVDLVRISATGEQTAVNVVPRPPAVAVTGIPQAGELASVTLEISASPTRATR